MKYWLFSCIILLLFSTSIRAEEGVLPAKSTVDVQVLVVDGATEEPLPAAKVVIKGQLSETYTDLDGMANFTSLEVGEYDIEISFVSYEKYSLKAYKFDPTTSQLYVKLYP